MTKVKIKGPNGTVEIEVPETVAKEDYSSTHVTVSVLLSEAVKTYNAMD